MTKHRNPLTSNILTEIADWKLEAKLEDNRRYFFHSADLNSLEDGSKCYVIGRKGTGKTAIGEYLSQRRDHHTFTQKLTFKNFPFKDLYDLSNSRFNPPNQYITLWKYLIYSSVAKMMLENEGIDSEIREKLAKIYSDDPVQSLPRTISKWTGRNLNFSVLGTGVGAGINQTRVETNTSWIERVEILEKLLEENIDQSRYVIIFDELDEDYRDVGSSETQKAYASLLTGLFKAVQDIKSIFPPKQYRILPVIFLRDDIYEFITDPDKTKWIDLMIELEWDSYKIRELLAFRISRAEKSDGPILDFHACWTNLFTEAAAGFEFHKDNPELRRKISIFDYITGRTFFRPRDYIRYLKLCAETSLTKHHTKISRPTVLRMSKAFSNYLRSEMEDELGSILPDIGQIFDIIAHIRKTEFSANEFVQAYSSNANRGLVTNRSPEQVLKTLFHFSVIGNSHGPSRIFRYLDREAHLKLDESISVHRGLYRALQIT